MPTRSGFVAALAGVVAITTGRVFGIVELFVIGAGLLGALGVALVTVSLRRPLLVIERWIHPAVLTVGDAGRVDLVIRNSSRLRSPGVTISEPVGDSSVARLSVGPLRPGGRSDAAYRLSAERRGMLRLGPLRVARRDLLGLARTNTVGAGVAEVMIAPRTYEVAMPQLGHGVLGRHLLTQAQRLGAGEFHGLRDYVEGDEPRSIHWRASARSEELKVRQHTTEGVRRCIVVLDRDRQVLHDLRSDDPAAEPVSELFERAITICASLVEASDRAGLTTRFATSGMIDLRGPDVATSTLRVLAPIQPGPPLDLLERDPGEGLGLVVVVTPSPTTTTWRVTDQLLDPSLARVGVFTDGHDAVTRGGRLSVDATSIDAFLAGWDALAGHGGLDVRSGILRHRGAIA